MMGRVRRRSERAIRAILRGVRWGRGWGDEPQMVALDSGTHAEPAGASSRRYDEEPRYSVRAQDQSLRHFTARGDQPRLTQAVLEAARTLSGSLGLVLVEVHDAPREWTAVDVDRSHILEGLLELRDLLGRGGLDLAVFSADESVEIFLDRFTTLEIRCGGWHEPRFRGLLEGLGFEHVPVLSSLPLAYDESPAWLEDDTRRVEEVCARLGLESIADPPDVTDSG